MNALSIEGVSHTHHTEILHGQQLISRCAELLAEGIKPDRMRQPENGEYHIEYRRPVKIPETQPELL